MRHHAGDAADTRFMAIENGICLLMCLRPHDIGDAEPLLVAVLRLDYPEHEDARPGAQRAAAREIHGAVAFRRVVDDDQEFRRVPGFVAAALLAHRLPGWRPIFARDRRRRKAQWWHEAWLRDKSASGSIGERR